MVPARRTDRRSPEADQYRRLYKTGRWRGKHGIRAKRLALEPICRMCYALGRVTVATIVDHIKPHRGNQVLFFDITNTQSLCDTHHSSDKQSEEIRGYSSRIGIDGWPVDGRHPFHAGPRKQWGYSIPHGMEPSAIPVTVVCGPPASGKSTYVERNAREGDTVIDFDVIREKVGGRKWDDNPIITRKAFAYRAKMLRGLKDKTHGRAWLIVTAPTRGERETWIKALGSAKIVTIDTPADECIARIMADSNRSVMQSRMIEAVKNWQP